MPSRIELNFETTQADWIAFGEEYMRVSPEWVAAIRARRMAAVRQALAASPLVVAGCAFLIGRGSSTSGMYTEGALAGLVFAGLVVFAVSRMDYRTSAERVHLEGLRRADLSDYVGPATVVVDERGIETRLRAMEVKLAWTAVQVQEVGGFILFAYGESGMGIPKRVFSSPDDAAAFLQQAAAWRNAAQLPPVERLGRYLAEHDVGCPKCGYNLRGVRSERCPECGEGLALEQLVGTKQ